MEAAGIFIRLASHADVGYGRQVIWRRLRAHEIDGVNGQALLHPLPKLVNFLLLPLIVGSQLIECRLDIGFLDVTLAATRGYGHNPD